MYFGILKAKRGLRQGDPISPLLFVLIMEYLHRVLQGLNSNPNFNFHHTCEKLKIINICFADDILIFVKGDLGSMKFIMHKIRYFSTATWLYISIPKSKIYLGGVDRYTQCLIQQEIWFDIGTMPFRYLRVPLDTKKLFIAYCQPLIENMMIRLKHWSTKLLSYAWRYQLVKNVIFSITNYLMQIFPLPKKVIAHWSVK